MNRLLVLTLIVAVCGMFVAGPVVAEEAATEPIKIGGLFALTGKLSQVGKPSKAVAEMVVEQVNAAGGIKGRPIELIVLDTHSDPAEALNALQRLIKKEGVTAVVGPTGTGSAMKCLRTIATSKMPTIACVGGTPVVVPTKPFVFKTPQKTSTAVERVYAYCKAKGMTKVAILTATDGFGKDGEKSLVELAEKMGITVVASESFNPADVDVSVPLGKLGASEADALICWAIGPAGATVAKNVKQLGITMPLIQCHGQPDPMYLNLAGEAAEGTLLPATKLVVASQLPDDDPQKAIVVDFVDKYENKLKLGPISTHSGYAFDALQILIGALEKAGPDDPEKLRAAIEQTKGYVGLSGIYNMTADDHCGLAVDSLVMVTVKDGKWKLLKD